jgi:hypothetical protein
VFRPAPGRITFIFQRSLGSSDSLKHEDLCRSRGWGWPAGRVPSTASPATSTYGGPSERDCHVRATRLVELAGPGRHACRSICVIRALHALWSLRYSGIRPLAATCMQRLNTAHAELNGPINAAFLCPCVHVLKLRGSRFSVSVGTSTVAGHACDQKAHWPRRCWDKGPRRRASHVDQRFARERALLLTLETSTQNDRLIELSYSLHL